MEWLRRLVHGRAPALPWEDWAKSAYPGRGRVATVAWRRLPGTL